MTGSIVRSRSGEMHVPGPSEISEAEQLAAAKWLISKSGNPAEAAELLGMLGLLPTAREWAQSLPATPVHRTATENPPAATTAPETVPLCRCPGPEKHELRMAANGKRFCPVSANRRSRDRRKAERAAKRASIEDPS